MKRKIGRILVPTMALLLVAIVLFVVFSRSQAVPISGAVTDKIGAYTGAGSGQTHNIKASLDLAHTDLDAMITYDTDVLALLGQSTGSVFYVDSSASGTTGVSWATAVNDLEEAMALCAADAGDIIIIAPGHAETISGAKAIDLDIAGITIIGLGTGELRPKFSFDTNTDSIAIGTDDIRIKNIWCLATVTAVANAIIVETGAENFIIEDCVFENETAGTDEFIDTILVSGTGSDGGIIRNSLFISDTSENAGPKSSINFVDCDSIQIYGNRFYGDAGDAHIFNETTASNFVSIHDNEIHQGAIGDAKLDTTPAISLVATTTGMIHDNIIATNVAYEDLAIVAADCHVFGNRYSEVQGSVLEVGKTYAITSSTTFAASPDTMWTIAGGRILITDLFCEIAANAAGSPGTLQISNNATAGAAWDRTFTTAVNVDAYAQGDLLRFTNAIDQGVIDLTANMGAGQRLSWMASPGVIEQLLSSTGTGGPLAWYMVFIPLEPGVTVTAP
jgi:hypothetical protein